MPSLFQWNVPFTLLLQADCRFKIDHDYNPPSLGAMASLVLIFKRKVLNCLITFAEKRWMVARCGTVCKVADS
uniref:Uncharacterized protein n=1 Tax=Anguilla anguilla TaxID=7936 RepID=A0A0E9W9F4_ANGAN